MQIIIKHNIITVLRLLTGNLVWEGEGKYPEHSLLNKYSVTVEILIQLNSFFSWANTVNLRSN